MTPLIRTAIIAILFAIALAQLAFGIANAQPQGPLPRCHLVTSCIWVPARTTLCPPPSAQTRPCQVQSIPARKVCSTSKTCDTP